MLLREQCAPGTGDIGGVRVSREGELLGGVRFHRRRSSVRFHAPAKRLSPVPGPRAGWKRGRADERRATSCESCCGHGWSARDALPSGGLCCHGHLPFLPERCKMAGAAERADNLFMYAKRSFGLCLHVSRKLQSAFSLRHLIFKYINYNLEASKKLKKLSDRKETVGISSSQYSTYTGRN